MSYEDVVKEDYPTLYWKFESNLTSSGPYSPSASTSAVSYASGKYGNGAVFSASNAHIQYAIGNPGFLFNSKHWTIELWFKRNNTTDTDYMELMNCYDTGSNNSITVYGSQGDKKPAIWYKKGAATTKVIGPVVDDTNWHHLVAVSDGTNVKLYLDNVSVGTPGTAVTMNYGNCPIWIGAYGNQNNNENWKGMMDEIAIYGNIALPEDKIAAHYNNQTTKGSSTPAFRGWGMPL